MHRANGENDGRYLIAAHLFPQTSFQVPFPKRRRGEKKSSFVAFSLISLQRDGPVHLVLVDLWHAGSRPCFEEA